MKGVRDASQAAYDASSALQSNVQVSWSPLVLLGYAIWRLSFRKSLHLYTHWVRRLNFWTSGGTLSAPTGCSPRDYGGLLAVDCSLYIALLRFYSFTRSGQAMSNETVSGRLRAVDFFKPVGAHRVHPLGVVPETTVECF